MSKLFDFTFDVVSRPDDRYYHTNWANKLSMEVRAETWEEAKEFTCIALGSAGDRCYWVFSREHAVDADIVNTRPIRDKESDE